MDSLDNLKKIPGMVQSGLCVLPGGSLSGLCWLIGTSFEVWGCTCDRALHIILVSPRLTGPAEPSPSILSTLGPRCGC